MSAALKQKIVLSMALPPPSTRRAIRESAGLSLRDIAEECGVTFQTISHWELGRREPQGANLKRYVRVLRLIRETVESERATAAESLLAEDRQANGDVHEMREGRFPDPNPLADENVDGNASNSG